MSTFTVEGLEVNVTPQTRLRDQMFGARGRAYSGKMRSDKIATHRMGEVFTDFMDEADALVLRAILDSPGPVLLGGDLIGDDAYFHVGPTNVEPLEVAGLYRLTFPIEETDTAPSDLLFSFDGDAPGSYTFTRSGSVGPYTDSAGILQSAAANVFRREWLWTNGVYTLSTEPDTAAGLTEAAHTNLIDSDDISAWSVVQTPVITGSISDPAGGTGAYRVADDNAGAVEFPLRVVTFTGDAVKTFIAVVREATHAASGQFIGLWDNTGSAYRGSFVIASWSAGVPSVTSSFGTYVGKRYVGNGYWALYNLTSTVTAASTHHVRIFPAYTLGETGSIDVYRINAYNSATIPAWGILDASEVGAVDTWYATTTFTPQTLTAYVKFTETGMVSQATAPLLHIGGATITTAERLTIESDGTNYIPVHGHADGNVTDTLGVAGPTFGQECEMRLVLESTGITFGQSIAAAAEVVGSEPTAREFESAWGGTRLYVGGPATFAQGPTLIHSVRIIRGVRTMAECRDWARARKVPRIAV